MKKNIGILGIILLLAIYFGSYYNKLVGLQEDAENEWAKVETAYQRRADLIPNLVKTAKRYAEHERGTLEDVIKARNTAMQTKIDPANATQEQMAQYQKAQENLGMAINVVFERYPELKADKLFLELQSQLEGTENRISVARDRYNDVVNKYNKAIRRFPGSLAARIFGFNKMPRFKSQEGADKAYDIDDAYKDKQ